VWAQNHSGPRSPLAGTWSLQAADEIRPDGVRVQSYGPEPRGVLMVDDDGRYSLQIFRTERPKFATGDKRRGTPQEYEAAVLGTSAHVGRVDVDSANGILVFHIELASFPNWEGTEQKRKYVTSGDELTYQVPTAASGNGTTPISVWRRVP
jgi:Lipocalin-like domain